VKVLKRSKRCKKEVFGREVGEAFSLLLSKPVVASVDNRVAERTMKPILGGKAAPYMN